MNISNIIQELKRRNVIKVATAYVIAGWIIIQVSDTVFPRLGLPDWTVTFIIALVGIGFPLSLIFAWAFELTPEGLKKSKEVDITESVTDRTGKKLNSVIISVLSVALFFVLIERVFFATTGMVEVDQSSISNASIAVLPFSDLSPNGDQEYFSDGLSEELLNVLTKAEEMRVAGRASSFKFKGQNENLKLIGAELDVDHILEGSVRKAGNTIRITAQLIKVEDGFQVWSETYDREYTAENVFRIQDEISQMVLNELKVRLLTSENSETLASTKEIPTSDIEAYEAYLRGTELLRNRNPDEIKLAIEQFERASELDPTFAEAFGYISFSYARLYEYGNIDKEQMEELIRYNSDRALFINTEIPRAYAGLSYLFRIKEDTTNAINAMKKAYELNPKDAEMVNSYANTLSLYQALNDKYADKSDSLYKVAFSLDPLNPVIANNMGAVYWRNKNFEKSMEVFDNVIEANPDYLRAYSDKIIILRGEGFGKMDEAFMEAYKGYKNNPESLDFIDVLNRSAGYFDLDSLQLSLTKEIIRLYPNNPTAEGARMSLKFDTLNTLLENQEIEKARAFGLKLGEEQGRDMEGFEEYLENLESATLFNEYFENEEYQKAYEIIRETYPEYLTDTLTTHPEYTMETWRIKYLFKQVGREDLVENLDKLEFEFGDWVEFEFDKDISKENPSVVYQLAMESLYNNNIDRYTEIVEELYFNRKYKFRRWNTFFNDPNEKELLNDPELKALIDRIEEDQQRMKNNVIEFLKDEGEWREEWEVTE